MPATRIIAVVVACLATAAPAAAAGRPTFTVPEPCVAGACQIEVTYVALPGELASVAVDWEHPGAAADGFAPDATLACAAPDGLAALVPALPADCTATSPPLATPGETRVAVRVTVAGLDTFVSQAVRVVAAVTREPAPVGDSCPPPRAGEQCGPGGGRRTPGGGEKVSHKGWPAITGILWKVTEAAGRHTATGGDANDELLGHHGDDTIHGGAGKDVIWGDWDPANNGTGQVDRLFGDAGADWISSSHGRNDIRGGAGADYVWAYYGRGTIDCGPGFDTLRVKLVNGYRVRNCERIKNFCSFGSKPGNAGGCYKPGERPKRRP